MELLHLSPEYWLSMSPVDVASPARRRRLRELTQTEQQDETTSLLSDPDDTATATPVTPVVPGPALVKNDVELEVEDISGGKK